MVKRFLAGTAVAVAIAMAGAAMAGPFEDATAAQDRGDYATALRPLRPIAGQGNALAEIDLAFMYYAGQGVPQDYAEAAKWYRLAAEQGAAVAQFSLGVLCAVGHGVPKDLVQAHMWLDLAAARGDQNAAASRGDLEARMTGDQLAEARRLAREWKPKMPL
jgi:TPR repeat protein